MPKAIISTTETNKPAANRRIDKEEIKRRTVGHWPEILSALAGIPAEALDGQHGPCPACGGKDRFRALDDFRETGGVYCNGCFSTANGDGIAAVQHFAGVDFSTALYMLAGHLGTSPNGNGKPQVTNGRSKREPKKAADAATLTKGMENINPATHAALLEMYSKAKPPITDQGVRQCRGDLVRWCGHRCIRLDGPRRSTARR